MAERLINKDALMNRTITYIGNDAYIALWRIEDEPEIEAEPVKHGKWIGHLNELFPSETTQECSVCHKEEYISLFHDNYCPYCGAKMDKEE